MKTYKHILIASDLSPESKIVADKALSMARKSAAQLSIVHIIEFHPIFYGGGEFALPIDGNIEESINKQAQEALTKEGTRLNIPLKNQYLETGSPAENLAALIKELNIDLVVLGSYEQRGLSFLLGSTANVLLHTMPCDVLAIHIKKQ